MRRFKAYWRVLATSAREDGANPSRLISGISQTFARILLVVAIYRVAYEVNPTPGLSFANAIWSIGTYFAFVLSLGTRNITRIIDLEVKAGTLETGIIKPLDWRLVKLMELFGKSGIEFLVQLVITATTLTLLVGLPNVSFLTPQILLLLVPMILLSIVTVACLFTVVGLSAVWTNDAMPVFRIVDKAAAALTGAFVPIALLPLVFQEVLRWSPFGIYAAPQQIFNPHIAEVIVPTFWSGLLWTMVMVALCQWVWWRVNKRIEVNGG